MTGRIALVAVLALGACKGSNSGPAPSTTSPAGSAGSGSAAPAPMAATKPALPVAVVNWVSHTAKDGAYSIELPGKPAESDRSGVKSVDAEFGATDADPRTSLCGVVAMALPDGSDPAAVLAGATERPKQNATVVEDKELKLGAHPGRSLIVDNPSQRKWLRVYVTDNAMYMLKCSGPVERAEADGPHVQKAFDSFALTAAKK